MAVAKKARKAFGNGTEHTDASLAAMKTVGIACLVAAIRGDGKTPKPATKAKAIELFRKAAGPRRVLIHDSSVSGTAEFTDEKLQGMKTAEVTLPAAAVRGTGRLPSRRTRRRPSICSGGPSSPTPGR